VRVRACVRARAHMDAVCKGNLNSLSYKVTYYACAPHKNNYSFYVFATFWPLVMLLVIDIYTYKSP